MGDYVVIRKGGFIETISRITGDIDYSSTSGRVGLEVISGDCPVLHIPTGDCLNIDSRVKELMESISNDCDEPLTVCFSTVIIIKIHWVVPLVEVISSDS